MESKAWYVLSFRFDKGMHVCMGNILNLGICEEIWEILGDYRVLVEHPWGLNMLINGYNI